MPNWKKIALSGSSPEFASLYVDNNVDAGSITVSGSITPSQDNVHSLGATNKRFLLNGGTPVTVTGSGTANTVTRFQSATTVEDSNIFSSDTLTRFEHSNNGNTIFTVSGSNGEMFNISDDIGDEILRVNDSSGLELFTVSGSGRLIAPNLVFRDSDAFVLSYESASGEISFKSASTADFETLVNKPALVSSSAQTVANLSNQDVDLGTGDLTATDITASNFTINSTLTAPTITGSLLRLSENGTGLRLTNIGGFEPQSGGVFNIFGNNNVTFGAGGSGASERVLTLVESNRHARFEVAVSASVFSGSFVGDGSGLTGISSNIISSSTVSDTFTNANTHSVAHTFGTKDVIVTLYDDNDDQFIPTRVSTPTDSSVVIYMDPATSGRVVIGAGGHIVSGSQNYTVVDSDITNLGDLTVSGSIIPHAGNTYDLGSAAKPWQDLYLSSASLYIDGQQVLSSTSETLTLSTDVGQSIKILETGADDITLQTDTGNIELKGTVEILSGKKITDSAGTIIQFGDSLGVTGSISVSGTVDGIDLQAFSSSVATSLDNSTADYTELTNVPSGIVSSSAQIASDISGSFTSTSASFATRFDSLTSDYTELTNVPSGIISSSAQVVSLTSDTTSFTTSSAVTASHNLGTKNVTVSIYDDNDFMIFPTSVKTHDTNNVYVSFNSSRTGRIVITK